MIGSSFTRNSAASGKGGGIDITGSGASGSVVQGNFIGTDANGANLGNTGDGVTIDNASNNTIGGTASGAGNMIAFNTGAGVTVSTGTGNADPAKLDIRQRSGHRAGQRRQRQPAGSHPHSR